eukprot:scaffold5185_cov110-Isochrysis_galbana.AAC.3
MYNTAVSSGRRRVLFSGAARANLFGATCRRLRAVPISTNFQLPAGRSVSRGKSSSRSGGGKRASGGSGGGSGGGGKHLRTVASLAPNSAVEKVVPKGVCPLPRPKMGRLEVLCIGRVGAIGCV